MLRINVYVTDIVIKRNVNGVAVITKFIFVIVSSNYSITRCIIIIFRLLSELLVSLFEGGKTS